MVSPRYSIIVPVLNESAQIGAALAYLSPLRANNAEVLAVDGDSSDDTVALASARCDRVISAPRGRGSQMNVGARHAQGEIFLFLHVDTILPGGALKVIDQAIRGGAKWGRFDVEIQGRSRWFPIIASMMNWRSRWTGIATGDQAIFVTRDSYFACGGFPDIPLMEDVAFSSKMRLRAPPVCLKEKVTVSGRRWETHGVGKTILKMWWLRLRYFFGVDPYRLAVEYGYQPRALWPAAKGKGSG